MRISEQIKNSLNAATHENGYPHNYLRLPEDIVREIHDWSGIEGFDPDKAGDMYTAKHAVKEWRQKNIGPRAIEFVVQHQTISGWEAMETTQNAEGHTCRVTYATEALAQASIDDYLAEVTQQISDGERAYEDGYSPFDFRVGTIFN